MEADIQQEIDICDKYTNGVSTTKLCELFKIHPHNLYFIFKKYNIKKRGHSKFKDYSKLDDIINLINNGMPMEKAIKTVGLTISTGRKYLRLKGFKSPHKNGTFQTKYTLNKNFLEKIDTSEKAQVLGVLYADGSVSKSCYLISLRLEKTDVEYLEKIKKVIGSNKPLYYLTPSKFISPSNKKTYTRRATAILDITNKKFYDDANTIGLIPNKKQKNIKMPKLSNNLSKDFIRGYFEGDGCITWTKNGFCWSVCGCQNLCKDIKNVIHQELNIKGHLNERKYIYVLSYKKINDIMKIISWIYTNTPFVMDRKYKKCKELSEIFKNKGYEIPNI